MAIPLGFPQSTAVKQFLIHSNRILNVIAYNQLSCSLNASPCFPVSHWIKKPDYMFSCSSILPVERPLSNFHLEELVM